MARGGRNRSDEVTEGNSAGPFMRGSFAPKLGVFRREGEIQAELRYHRRGRLGFRPLAFGLGGGPSDGPQNNRLRVVVFNSFETARSQWKGMCTLSESVVRSRLAPER